MRKAPWFTVQEEMRPGRWRLVMSVRARSAAEAKRKVGRMVRKTRRWRALAGLLTLCAVLSCGNIISELPECDVDYQKCRGHRLEVCDDGQLSVMECTHVCELVDMDYSGTCGVPPEAVGPGVVKLETCICD